MRGLAAYVMRGRMQAVLAAALCAFLALTVPFLSPLSYISGAIVALVALRQSLLELAGVIGLAAMAIAGLAWLSAGSMAPALVYTVVFWLPAAIFGLVLRHTGLQGHVVAAAGALSVGVLLVIHAVIGDVPGWWAMQLERIVAEHGLKVGIDAIQSLAKLMSGLAVGGVVIGGHMLSVLLARWWQSLLFNPGGFREEFYALRLPRMAVLLMVVVTAYALLSGARAGSLPWDLVMIGIMMLTFQGVAIVHAGTARYNVPALWLVVMYVGLLFAPVYTMLGLALLGFGDHWIDFRARRAD